MKRKSRLSRGNPARRKDRLTHESLKDAARSDVVALMSRVPNDRLFKYLGISKRDAAANPALGMIKEEAQKEIARRQSLQVAWKKGKLSPEEIARAKIPLRQKIAEAARKGTGVLGKGLQLWWKAVSGEGVRELQEAIETAGMKPEEKKAYVAAKRKRQAKEEEAERLEMAQFFPTVFPEEAAEAECRREAAEKPAARVAEPVVPAEPEPLPVAEPEEPAPVTIHIHAGEKARVLNGRRPSIIEQEPEEEERPDIELAAEEDVFETMARERAAVDVGRAELAGEMEEAVRERQELAESGENVHTMIDEGRRELAEEQVWLRGEQAEVQAARHVHRRRPPKCPRRKRVIVEL